MIVQILREHSLVLSSKDKTSRGNNIFSSYPKFLCPKILNNHIFAWLTSNVFLPFPPLIVSGVNFVGLKVVTLKIDLCS